jgi:hypothetical protein
MDMDKWKEAWSQQLGWEKILIWFTPWVLVVLLIALFSTRVEELKQRVAGLEMENTKLVNELKSVGRNNP